MHIAFSKTSKTSKTMYGQRCRLFHQLVTSAFDKISTEMKKRHERYKKYGTEVNIHIETSFNMCFIFDEMTR